MNKRFRNSLAVFSLLTVLMPLAVAQVPRSKHVWLITEENHSYEKAVPAMPYLVSLGKQYGIATQHYANMHNSIAALMHFVAGNTVTTNNQTSAFFSSNNIVRQLLTKGLTWKSYQESLPSVGFLGVSSYPYVRRHNPLAYFTDVNTPVQRLNVVPYPADMTHDLAGNYNYITPNLKNDAHDGTMATADSWLRSHVPAILARPEFQPGGDGIMIITFDEGDIGGVDSRCSATVSTGCGGRVLTVVVGPRVKRGYQSTVWHNHESVLKTTCVALGITTCPGAAQTAKDLGEFFMASGGVNLVSPTNGATTGTAVRVSATAHSTQPITAVRVYVDNVNKYQTSGSTVNTSLTLATGGHNVVVQAWDKSGAVFKSSAGITVK